jgi:hypothetical protein
MMDKETQKEITKRLKVLLDNKGTRPFILVESLEDNPSPGTVVEVAKGIKEELERIKQVKTNLQKAYDLLTQTYIPDYVEDQGITQIVTEDRRLEVRNQMRVNLPAGNRAALHQWLQDNDLGHMISETVQPQTLKAFVKDAMENQLAYPAELLKIEPYRQAVLVKK